VVPHGDAVEAGHERDEGVAEGRPAPADRQPGDVQRDLRQQDQADPEVRRRHADERGEHRAEVDPGVAAHRRQHPERDADADRDHERPEAQLDRGRHPLEDDRGHRQLLPDRGAEVALQGLAQPADVLHRERLVEAVDAVEALDVGDRRLLAEHDPDRVAGRQVHEHEHQDRHPEEDERQREEPPDDVLQHASAYPTSVNRSGRRRQELRPGLGDDDVLLGSDRVAVDPVRPWTTGSNV
jgi:hypothetical protein